MLRKLQVLAAAARLRTFSVADLARASKVSETTVHTVLQRCPVDWFNKLKTTTGARGGQPNRIELTAAGAAGINERLGKLPNSEPLATLAPIAEQAGVPVGLSAARASLQKLGDAPATEEELRQAAQRNLDWAEAELTDGDFAADADALLAEIRELRRQLAEPCGKQHSQQDPTPHLHWITRFAAGLRSLAAGFEFHGRRARKGGWRYNDSGDMPEEDLSAEQGSPFFSYFGSDPRQREMACFAAGTLANEMRHRLGQAWTLPAEAHELLRIGEPGLGSGEFTKPRQLFLCVSTPHASEELRIILKQTRLLIDRQCFTPESWVLDFGHSTEVERVTRRLALNYESNARQPSHWSRWLDHVFASAARSPLAPGALPYTSAPALESKVPVATDSSSAAASQDPPAARLTIRRLSANTLSRWTGKHPKGTTIEATIRQVDANGATIDLGGGLQGYLKASELSTEPVEDARALLKVDQKMQALYKTSSRKRRTITVVVVNVTEKKFGHDEPEQSDNYSALPKKMRSKSHA